MSKGKLPDNELVEREAQFGLTREALQDLLVLSRLPGERKALGILFYLLEFVQGKSRFPRKEELSEVVSDCLDRNLGKEAFRTKWQLNLSPDPSVDDPEKYYLETLEKLALIARIQEGWNGWQDGDLPKKDRPKDSSNLGSKNLDHQGKLIPESKRSPRRKDHVST